MKTHGEIEINDENEVILKTRTNLGHLSDVSSYAVPDDCQDELEQLQRDYYKDAKASADEAEAVRGYAGRR